ncbi:MAG: hypothetical protein NZ521_07920, partial [Flammeovirgaceae bacterium]|nr:hypothetical protein [Flammeovirgaceae bacterium]MDW8287541.1 hypothetical protein [Flammeovirgaceae bacterium]
MKYLKILLFALFFLYVSPLFAQKQSIEFTESNFAKKKKSLQVALRNLKIAQGILEIDQDYASALKYYLRANKFNPKNAQLNYIIGKCYLYQKNPDLKSAIKHLEEASSFTACDPEIVYLLACTYQRASEWQKAINEFKRYIKMVEDQNEKVAKAQKRLQECESGKTLSQNPRHITIEHLGKQFNTRFDEMGPVISADEKMMLFTAKRNTTTGYEMSEDGLFYEDIYVAHKNKGGNWTKFTKLQGVNSNGSDAIVSITSNGKRIILYKGVQNGDLYAGTIEKDKVYDIKPLPNVFNTPFRETSATMNSENNLIFFTSNRPGGKGGLDIWFSRKNENNTWEEAQNMGELINTPYDEEGVCLSADGKTLYFSSKGHNSIGGYDIFKTVFREGTWSKPENIGIPLNTPNDEVFVSLSQDGKRLYFSSFRSDSYGASDIYIATLLGEPKEPELTPIAALNTQQAVEVGLYTPSSTIERILLTDDYTVVKGKVLDPDTGKPL